MESFDLWDTDPWIISDTHFKHMRIQEYANRPEGWENLIIKNWNDKIKYGDTVLHLGDFSLATREQNTFLAEILNGQIYLLCANHDHKNINYYSKLGITLLKPEDKIIPYENILFTHKPLKDLPEDKINIHGHSHLVIRQDHRYINMCVENWNYMPYRFSTILELIKKFPNEIITGELIGK